MLRSPLNSSGPRAARFLTFLTALVALAFAAISLAPISQSEAKSTKRIELGARNVNSLKPNCGRDFSRDCVVEGKVTAFQALSGRYPGRNFVVPFNGKLVTWSIALANPTRVKIEDNDAQLPFANSIFGTPAQAGISILRQVQKRKKGGPRYKLVRKSSIQILNPYFGTKATFAVEPPLNVFEGNIVALTIPTWAPALWKPRACNAFGDDVLNPAACLQAEKKYTWRASRVPRGEPETCGLSNNPVNEQLEKTAPQTRVDSIRRYGCYYGRNAVLYSALIVGR